MKNTINTKTKIVKMLMIITNGATRNVYHELANGNFNGTHSQQAMSGTDEDEQCYCYRTSLNWIINTFIHVRIGSNANVIFGQKVQITSIFIKYWQSKWLIHFVKLNFLVDFFCLIKIIHTFISFVWKLWNALTRMNRIPRNHKI